MKEYILSIETMLTVEAENEEELYEKALEKLSQMISDRQVSFEIVEELEN